MKVSPIGRVALDITSKPLFFRSAPSVRKIRTSLPGDDHCEQQIGDSACGAEVASQWGRRGWPPERLGQQRLELPR